MRLGAACCGLREGREVVRSVWCAEQNAEGRLVSIHWNPALEIRRIFLGVGGSVLDSSRY